MDEVAREQLAKRLSAMKFKQVRREIRALDPEAELKFYRNSVRDEYHTLWVLPNAGVSITLVEKVKVQETNRAIGGGPRGWRARKVEFNYIEARVEPLARPAHKRGATGPSPAVQNERLARQG